VAQDFFVEIGTEELPPKSLKTLATALQQNILDELSKLGLGFTDSQWYAAPRRLAVRVNALAAQQADKVVEKRGPAIAGAFDANGEPTKAAQAWAASNGITVAEAERLETDKGAWLIHKAKVTGVATVALLEQVVATALAKLPIAKPMRWGANDAEFIRPVHTIIMLYGNDVVPATILGKAAGRVTHGHRFHAPAKVEIANADTYLSTLEQAYVVADYDKRKAFIKAEVEKTAESLKGIAQMDEALLEEVSSLVEWPVVLVGSFEERFLEVPPEPLMSTMKDNQKYFPLKDAAGKLLNKFIFVANIASKDPQQIISGNEKVVRPRLTDAQFFFGVDKKTKLADRLESLGTVLFQQKLGTLLEKSQRISELAGYIAGKIGADVEHAKRAGLLSKTDLMSNMVGEFPETQGIMGMHYARIDGEAEAVALALNEQYMPRFAGDALPGQLVSCAVAIADKLDSLVGIFGIGQAPKGDKDPFALRRAAIGALRIMVEKQLDLDIWDLISASKESFGSKLNNPNLLDEVDTFMLARMRSAYLESGISADIVQAVLDSAVRSTIPLDIDRRVKAVASFKTLEQSVSLAAANKRVSNLLVKATDVAITGEIDPTLFQESAESILFSALERVEKQNDELRSGLGYSDYSQALSNLAALKDPVDAFFDQVMVNADDLALRTNRLRLLSRLKGNFIGIADISYLQF
jgi:glycyl-tRNA synthetase beta chain